MLVGEFNSFHWPTSELLSFVGGGRAGQENEHKYCSSELFHSRLHVANHRFME